MSNFWNAFLGRASPGDERAVVASAPHLQRQRQVAPHPSARQQVQRQQKALSPVRAPPTVNTRGATVIPGAPTAPGKVRVSVARAATPADRTLPITVMLNQFVQRIRGSTQKDGSLSASTLVQIKELGGAVKLTVLPMMQQYYDQLVRIRTQMARAGTVVEQRRLMRQYKTIEQAYVVLHDRLDMIERFTVRAQTTIINQQVLAGIAEITRVTVAGTDGFDVRALTESIGNQAFEIDEHLASLEDAMGEVDDKSTGLGVNDATASDEYLDAEIQQLLSSANNVIRAVEPPLTSEQQRTALPRSSSTTTTTSTTSAVAPASSETAERDSLAETSAMLLNLPPPPSFSDLCPTASYKAPQPAVVAASGTSGGPPAVSRQTVRKTSLRDYADSL